MKVPFWRRFIVLPLVIIGLILSASTIQPANASDTLRAHASARNFLIGAALAASPLQNNTTYADLAKAEFNLLTPENEMKMDALQPTEGTFNYTNADAIVNFGNTNNMKIHGHTLVWHSQVPGWLNSKTRDRATFLPIMQNHIQQVVQHFGNNIWAWDVVNEAISDNGTIRPTIWQQSIGSDYIDQAFMTARQYAPASTKLLYNDYNIETINVKSNFMYAMVQSMINRGIPIDGVGFQMHIQWDTAPTYAEVKANFERFTALGLEVHITEMDVALGTTFPNLPTQAQLDQQKEIYAYITKACLDTPGCNSLTVWGVDDGSSWLNAFRGDYQHPLLFDRSFSKKPAYWGVHDTLTTITPTFTPVPPTPTATAATGALRIDSGATQNYTDTFGNTWVADTGFVLGGAITQNVTVTSNDDPQIYRTARENLTDYNIAVANGDYGVRLHFAETSTGVSAPGQRVFNVSVQGTALNNVDLFAEVGGRNVAIVKIFNVSVSNGVLNIHFTPIAGNPIIQGIEILPGVGPLPTSTQVPTFTPTFTATPLPPGSNLLFNPGFENGTSSWNCFGPCSMSPTGDPVHSGSGAALTTGRTNNWNGPSQNIQLLGLMVNGGVYNTSVWVRSASAATPTIHVTIKLTDSTGDRFLRLSNSGVINNTGWIELTGTTTLTWTGALTAATFYVESEESAGPFADFVIDDAFFAVTGATATPSPTLAPNSNLLVDPGMEQGTVNWYCFNCTPVSVTDPVHSGTRALQVPGRTASWNGPAQNITAASLAQFTQGGTYTASVWIRSASGTPNAHIVMKLTDDTGDRFSALTNFAPINSTDWTQLSGSATLTWTGTLVAATFYVETNESAAPFVDFYVDDAFLSVSGGSTSTPSPIPTNTATLTPTPTATETSTNTPTATPTNTPTSTSTPTPTPTFTRTPTPTPRPRLRKLDLDAVCSPDPARFRVWRVQSTNPYPVDFDWFVVGLRNIESGSGTVPAASGNTPGQVTFTSRTQPGPNLGLLFVNGSLQDVDLSTSSKCLAGGNNGAPTFQPPRP